MIRIPLFILAFFGIFAFPWPYAAALAFIAALFVPPIGLAFGLLSDALYYAHGGWPVATFYGIAGCVIAYFINKFLRARVSDLSL